MPNLRPATTLIASLLFCASTTEAAAPVDRYVVSGDGTVYDTRTKLRWQQASSPALTHGEAKSYCANLGGRMPSIKELYTLVDLSRADTPKIDAAAFPDTQGNYYWSTTPSLHLSNRVLTIYFNSGFIMTIATVAISKYPVRCIRQ